MFTPSSRQALGEILLPQISSLEPTLAEELTSMILEMEDEEIILLIGDGNALRAQVQRSKDDVLRSSTASTTEEVDSDDQEILTPSSSDEESSPDEEIWATPDESISLIAAMTAAPENPQVTSDEQRYGNAEGPEESTRDSSNSETKRSARGDQGAEEFFEKTRDPAGWHTVEELATSSTTFQRQGTRIKIPQRYKCHDPLATTPMVSYGAGGNPLAPEITGPAPQESDKSGVTRASRVSEHAGLAAAAQTVAQQPRAPAPMEVVRHATPARRATQAAANGVYDTVTGCPPELEAACCFASSLCAAAVFMAGSYTCIFGLH